MASPVIKLHYFGLRGRGEVPRLVLYAANREFEDNRVSFPEWAALKPKSPFGTMPFLEVGEEAFGQSIAITAYLARDNGLYGSSNVDAVRIEQIVQTREDLLTEEVKAWKEKDEDKKAELTKAMNEDIYPKFIGIFEKLIKENQARTSSSYSVGDKLSLADIVVFEGVTTLSQNNPELLDKYPAVKGVAKLVSEVEGVKKYLETRQKSDL